MPTTLPDNVAEAWLYKDLTEQSILDIAHYQVASAEMVATPLHQDCLKDKIHMKRSRGGKWATYLGHHSNKKGYHSVVKALPY